MNDLTTQLNIPGGQLSPGLAILLDENLFKRVEHGAKVMSQANGILGPHLAGQPHACFAVISRAINWNLDPYFVAMSTYATPGGKVGFEGKLVHAILEASNQFDGQIEFEHIGDWSKIEGKWHEHTYVDPKTNKKKKFAVADWKPEDEEGLGVIVRGQVKGEAEPRVLKFMLKSAYPRNATTWPTRPMEQIKAPAIRAFANTACPGIFAGLPGDPESSTGGMVDITDIATEIDNEPATVEFINDAYNVGFAAYGAGVKYRDAPGHYSATDYDDWCKGWQEASKAEHGDSEAEGAKSDPEPSEPEDGPGEETDTTRKEKPLETKSAETAGPRSLTEMVKACEGNKVHENRVKFAHAEALKGNDALSAWLKEQLKADIEIIAPFANDLRAIATAAENDGELPLK